jgi:ABC-type antimicrobial peptide transport system permease subunit
MHAVQRRRREIALRMVLGASPADIMRETGRSGLRLAAIGVGVGVLGAATASRLLVSVAYGVSPLNPIGLMAVTIAVARTTLAAVWVPARRAASQDSALVLRAE